MKMDDGTRRVRRLIWGLFLIALGGAFLLERFGVFVMPPVSQLWPAVFFVIAIADLASRRYGQAVMFTVLGAWFFACEFEWKGLTYGNSWGLALVAVGASLVVGALSGDRAAVMKIGVIGPDAGRRQAETEERHE